MVMGWIVVARHILGRQRWVMGQDHWVETCKISPGCSRGSRQKCKNQIQIWQ